MNYQSLFVEKDRENWSSYFCSSFPLPGIAKLLHFFKLFLPYSCNAWFGFLLFW